MCQDITERKQAEQHRQELLEMVQAERDTLAALVNSMSDEVWLADTDKKFTLMNPSALREFGLSDGKVNIEELAAALEVYRADGSPRPIEEAPPLRALNGEAVRNEEEIIRTPGSGELRYRQVSSTPMRDSHGDISGSVSVVRDITERKRAEEALVTSEELSRQRFSELGSIYHSAPVGLCVFDSDLRFMSINDRLAEINGVAAADHIGHTVREVVPTIADQAEGILKHIQETGEPVLNIELEGTTPSQPGVLRTWNEQWLPLKDAQGKLLGINVVVEETTERKQAEGALRESEERFRVAQEVSPDGFTILRPVRDASARVVDFTIIYQNDTISRLAGTDPKAVLGQNLLVLFPGHRGSNIFEAYRQVAETGKPVVLEDSYEGETITRRTWFRLVVVSMGQDIAILAQDITERKWGEEGLRQQAQLLDLSTDAIFTWELEGTIRYWNQGAATLYGYEQTEAIGRNSHDLLATVFPHGLAQLKGELERDGQWQGELHHASKDGHQLIVESHMMLISFNEKHLVLETNRNITERTLAEEALRESEQKYRSLFEALEQGVIYLNAAGEVIIANPAAERILGLSLAKMRGVRLADPLWRVIREDGMSMSIEEYAATRALKTGESVHDVIVGMFNSQENDYRWIIVDAIPQIRPGEKKPEGVFTIFSDITELKRSEGALQQLNEELEERVQERTAELQAVSRYARCLIEASVDPLVTISPEGKITDVNQATEEVTGVARHRLIGSDFSGYFMEPDQADAGYQQVFAQGGVRDYPLTIRHTSGHTTDVLYNATLYCNEAGQVQGVFASARDVTARKRAEAAVQAERQRLFSVLETMPAMVCLLTPDYHVAFANRSFREKFGESDGRHCYEYCFGRSEPCEFCESYNVLKTGKPHYWELTGPGGSIIAAHDFPFTDADGSPLILQMDIDITQQRRTEAALKKSREQFRQLSNELLQAQENERKRVAREIHDNAGQVLAAIKYRVESAYLKLEKSGSSEVLQPVKDLVPIVQACIDDLRRLQMELRPTILDDMGVGKAVEWFCREFQKTYPSIRVERTLAVDEAELPEPLKLVIFRIVQEALNNAGKHSDAEQVTISLQKKGGTLVLQIKDNGEGFDLDKAHQIEAFNKGLGLSSMRERVQYSGGRLSMKSAPGQGTLIEARWPKKALV